MAEVGGFLPQTSAGTVNWGSSREPVVRRLVPEPAPLWTWAPGRAAWWGCVSDGSGLWQRTKGLSVALPRPWRGTGAFPCACPCTRSVVRSPRSTAHVRLLLSWPGWSRSGGPCSSEQLSLVSFVTCQRLCWKTLSGVPSFHQNKATPLARSRPWATTVGRRQPAADGLWEGPSLWVRWAQPSRPSVLTHGTAFPLLCSALWSVYGPIPCLRRAGRVCSSCLCSAGPLGLGHRVGGGCDFSLCTLSAFPRLC